MSHFVGLCFGNYWEDDLEQYSESYEVESYIAYTKEQAIETAIKNHEANYNYAEKRLKDENLSTSSYDYYKKIFMRGPSLSYEEAWKHVKEDWGYDIDENENLLTNYNPNATWDWYSIGGRWGGFLSVKELDEDGDRIETNQTTVGEVDWEYMMEHKFPPFCYVTEEGEWCEKGEMGWFGITHDEKPEESWRKQFMDYVNSLDKDCLVTVIDFHI